MPFSPLPFPAHLKADRRGAAGLGGWFSPVLSRGLLITPQMVTQSILSHLEPAPSLALGHA